MSRMREYAQATVAGLLERVTQQLERAAVTPDEDAVHDVRVSIRRASQALRVFSGLLPHREARAIRGRLKMVLDEASAVRDCDIALGLYAEAGLPNSHPLWEEMRARRVLAESGFRLRVLELVTEARAGVWESDLKLVAP
jgi:CHAD domain-containing protein